MAKEMLLDYGAVPAQVEQSLLIGMRYAPRVQSIRIKKEAPRASHMVSSGDNWHRLDLPPDRALHRQDENLNGSLASTPQ
jgi:hypothetical protein